MINIFKEQFDKINKNGSSNNVQTQGKLFNAKETVKLEIVNKGMGLKRDYKLTSNMKFEHFYDYF